MNIVYDFELLRKYNDIDLWLTDVKYKKTKFDIYKMVSECKQICPEILYMILPLYYFNKQELQDYNNYISYNADLSYEFIKNNQNINFIVLFKKINSDIIINLFKNSVYKKELENIFKKYSNISDSDLILELFWGNRNEYDCIKLENITFYMNMGPLIVAKKNICYSYNTSQKTKYIHFDYEVIKSINYFYKNLSHNLNI